VWVRQLLRKVWRIDPGFLGLELANGARRVTGQFGVERLKSGFFLGRQTLDHRGMVTYDLPSDRRMTILRCAASWLS
jgi:hypothetical protein